MEKTKTFSLAFASTLRILRTGVRSHEDSPKRSAA